MICRSIQNIPRKSFDRAIRQPPQNMIAYDRYVYGMALVLRLNKNDNLTAQQEAFKVIELDPNYARGHMLLSWTHLYGFFSGWFEDKGLALSLGHEAAMKSIECDQNDFLGYRALLGASYMALGLETEARAEISKVIKLEPDLSITWILSVTPFKDIQVTERYASLLAKAGLSD